MIAAMQMPRFLATFALDEPPVNESSVTRRRGLDGTVALTDRVFRCERARVIRRRPVCFVDSSGIGRDGGPEYSFEFYTETRHTLVSYGTHAIAKLRKEPTNRCRGMLNFDTKRSLEIVSRGFWRGT